MKRKFLILSLCIASGVAGMGAFAATAPSNGQGIYYYRAGFASVAKPLLISEFSTDAATRAETCYNLGKIYFEENKVDSAAYYFNKGVEADATNSLNAVGLIMLKIKADPIAAETEFKNILKLKQNKKNVDIYLAVANAYLANNLLEQAVSYQEKAKELKSKYAPVYVVLGDIELAKKNVGEACRNYEQAIYFDDQCKEAYIKYARAYKSVNTPLAIEKLNALKQKDPAFLLTSRELADIYFSTNDFAKSAEAYEAYLQSGNSSVIDLTKYAFILFLSHQFQKSLDVTKMGLSKEPLNPVFNRLVMYNDVELNRPADAITAADIFFNKSKNPEFTYLDYRYYGQAFRDNKQIDLAIPQYEKAVQVDSTKIELWKDIADMYGKLDKYSKALEAYQIYMRALPQDKVNADVYMDLGRNYYFYAYSNDNTLTPEVKKSLFLKADSAFAVAATKEENYRANFWRARANFGLDPETTQGLAKPYYEQTASYLEAKADTRYNSILIECYRYLGFYYLQTNDLSQSTTFWNKILAIDPNNDTAKKGLAGIKGMKKK